MTQPSDQPPATNHSTESAVDRPQDEDRNSGSTDVGLITVEWDASRVGETTLVTVHATNTHSAPRKVRIENSLDGPVLPPRRHGVSETGWDAEGVTRCVPGGETTSVGYACRAPPERPPITVNDGPADGSVTSTPVERALRSLGEHAPPRAVVSEASPDGSSRFDGACDSVKSVGSNSSETFDTRDGPEPSGAPEDADAGAGLASTDTGTELTDTTPLETGTGGTDHTADAAEPTEERSEAGAAGPKETNDVVDTEGVSAPRPLDTVDVAPIGAVDQPRSDDARTATVPTSVTAWFRAVEARLDTAERLAGGVHEATPVVASLGGRAGIEVFASTLAADAAALARTAERADELAARVDETHIPDVGAETDVAAEAGDSEVSR